MPVRARTHAPLSPADHSIITGGNYSHKGVYLEIFLLMNVMGQAKLNEFMF